MKYNIITIDEMTDVIYDFFHDNSKQVLYVGGMVGTELFSLVTSEATEHYHFNHMLFLEGCQDYLGLTKEKMFNYLFYPAILEQRFSDPIEPYDPFKGKWMNPKKEYCTIIDVNRFTGFQLLIINNAHLIEPLLINDIINNFDGKVVCITDPFDVGGDIYSGYPCICDTFVKLPVIQSVARGVYNMETRFIDKHKSSLTEIKMQNRSIGKIDDKQYISNDPEIIDLVREKQYKAGFRKNQKVIVTPRNKRRLFNTFGDINTVIYTNSMMTIDVSQLNPWMNVRLYQSKEYIKCSLTYDLDVENEVDINVTPANILTVQQSIHHRYKNMVLVLDENLPLTTSERYSLLKNTNNMQVVLR